jgi:hypothetical protein
MWSRRHFTDAHPASLDFVKALFGGQKAPDPVIDNLDAVPLPMRRLSLGQIKLPGVVH